MKKLLFLGIEADTSRTKSRARFHTLLFLPSEKRTGLSFFLRKWLLMKEAVLHLNQTSLSRNQFEAVVFYNLNIPPGEIKKGLIKRHVYHSLTHFCSRSPELSLSRLSFLWKIGHLLCK